MAKQIKAWQASDGSLHEGECAAATRDVELIVEKSPLAENIPYAKLLVTWLTTEATMIRKMLEAHESACPKDAVTAELERDDALVPGVTVMASNADLIPHMKNCKARQSGWFRHCSCGAFSTAQIEGFKQAGDEAFGNVGAQ